MYHRKVAGEEHYKEVVGCYCIDYIAVYMRDKRDLFVHSDQ